MTIVNAFRKILNDLKRKPKKIWVDKGSEFYIRSVKSWLEKNMKMCSTIKFISIWLQYDKNVYIDKLDGVVNENNSIYIYIYKYKYIYP